MTAGDERVTGGTLAAPSSAPSRGEATFPLATGLGFSVEQILSGALAEPVDYLQAHDEWVVVLAGSAVLEVDAEPRELRAGDWLLLPASAPHRLVTTEPGTSWLAVRSTP
ncbi:MAG TPA: cupin domain-containing protein [Acidimicrobiia bacterium]|nr:cupin domain-containing protein [Acidimicrobiia bacterium]